MRVKITKTVDLNDVPFEFDAILGDCSIRLGDIGSDLNQIRIDDNNDCDIDASELINNIRERLVLIDANLEDALGMLEGYRKIVNGANNEVSGNPSE